MPDPASSVALEAGPISCVLANGDLRSIRVDGEEVVQRLYFALRDGNWGTIPATLRDLTVTREGGGFKVGYRAEHRTAEIGFSWHAETVGTSEGCLRFSASGAATRSFLRNRIGLCVLHPASAAGHRVRVTHHDGTSCSSAFPLRVSPHQPFLDICALRHTMASGAVVEFGFEGEVFEMEDQRNWTDASFKTYSTPLALPFPVEMAAGEPLAQAVTITVVERAPAPRRSTPATRPLSIVEVQSHARAVPLPALGVDLGAESPAFDAPVVTALSRLSLAHLRLELTLGEAGVAERLEQATGNARAVGSPLALALRVPPDPGGTLAELARLLGALRPPLASVAVFSEGAPATTSRTARSARAALAGAIGGAPLGGGTRAWFAELNRNPPEPDLIDFVCYAVSPQVHAFDDRSVLEALDGQTATVESAHALFGRLPVHVGPITLRPQWNPDAIGPAAAPAPGELPPEVDPRQRLPFAAAWTAASLKRLALAGARQVTYFEAVGWKGLLERSGGSRSPAVFPSRPGERFRVFELLEALAPFAGGTLRVAVAPEGVEAFAVSAGGRERLWVANLTPELQRFRGPGGAGHELSPYATVWLDA